METNRSAPLCPAPAAPRPAAFALGERACVRACVKGKRGEPGCLPPGIYPGEDAGCTPMRRGLRREARERDCERIRSTCGDEREMGGGWRLAWAQGRVSRPAAVTLSRAVADASCD